MFNEDLPDRIRRRMGLPTHEQQRMFDKAALIVIAIIGIILLIVL